MSYFEELRKHVGTKPLILPGAAVIIRDQEGRVLLQERYELEGYWDLPGGLMELGESFEETARREIFEETGRSLGELEFIDILSGKDYYVVCPNGDEVYSITAIYGTISFSGKLRIDYVESRDMRFFPIHDLPAGILPSTRQFIYKFSRKKSLQQE